VRRQALAMKERRRTLRLEALQHPKKRNAKAKGPIVSAFEKQIARIAREKGIPTSEVPLVKNFSQTRVQARWAVRIPPGVLVSYPLDLQEQLERIQRDRVAQEAPMRSTVVCQPQAFTQTNTYETMCPSKSTPQNCRTPLDTGALYFGLDLLGWSEECSPLVRQMRGSDSEETGLE